MDGKSESCIITIEEDHNTKTNKMYSKLISFVLIVICFGLLMIIFMLQNNPAVNHLRNQSTFCDEITDDGATMESNFYESIEALMETLKTNWNGLSSIFSEPKSNPNISTKNPNRYNNSNNHNNITLNLVFKLV